MKNINEVKKVNKIRLLNVIKYAVFLIIAVFSYFASVYLNGFNKTNERLLMLGVCTIIGFVLFFLIYAILYGLTALKYAIKLKKAKDVTVNCDDLLTNLIAEKNYKFNYDLRKSVSENLKIGANISYNLVKEIANGYGNSGKFVYLDYTLYDALEIFGNATQVLKVKADAIFGLLHLQDKPISILEKKLTDILEGDIVEQEEKSSSVKSKIGDGLKHVASKVALIALKAKISALVNDIIEYVGFEAFRVYSKQDKEFDLSVLNLQVEEVEEVVNA